MPVPIELGPRRLEYVVAFSLIAVTMATAPAAVMADAFGPVHYDPKSDELIVTMLYSVTNPDHHFSIQWGECRKLYKPGQPRQLDDPPREIIVSILDDQWNDAAKTSYTKIVRVPLAGLSCRPARVTLWTSPAFYGPHGTPGPRATLDIP
jgi:hypothetical protein